MTPVLGRAFLILSLNLLSLAVQRRDSMRCTALVSTPIGRVERCHRTASDLAWRGIDHLDVRDPRAWTMRCPHHTEPASSLDADDEQRDAA